MNLEQLIQALTPEVYENLKRAVELGRWADGRSLVAGQRELCIEAIIHYETVHDLPAEQRVGYMEGGCKSADKDDVQTLTLH